MHFRGTNGSGKSTLLRTVLGLQRLLKGRIENTFNKNSFVPQASAIDSQFPISLEDFVRLGVPLHFQPETLRLSEVLHELGIFESRRNLFGNSSGGERQRAMLARAIISDPDLLVLDEPTAGIDRTARIRVLDIINKIRGAGTTILMTSHDSIAGLKVDQAIDIRN
ncbi:MAG: ATP-binding cassette domain-containing protein [Spirochaetia bacterium]|nr:ATP-binding cassette domain-containing protein [Spirochaetia bacterium]